MPNGTDFPLESARPKEASMSTRALGGIVRQIAMGDTKSMWQSLVGASDFAKRHPVKTGSLAAMYLLGKKSGLTMQGGRVTVPLSDKSQVSFGKHSFPPPTEGLPRTPFTGIQFKKVF